jgi:hypothetical protein
LVTSWLPRFSSWRDGDHRPLDHAQWGAALAHRPAPHACGGRHPVDRQREAERPLAIRDMALGALRAKGVKFPDRHTMKRTGPTCGVSARPATCCAEVRIFSRLDP